MKREKYLFRFVPTMKCNFNCPYCFEGDVSKRSKQTMFDVHTASEWIESMKKFSANDIEIYLWGGEPFLLDDTYTVVREWMSMDHVVSGCRIDTNTFYAEKIANRCPSNKLKLNCSYHMQYLTLEDQYKKIKTLRRLDMIGMMNFVASEYNITKLHEDYKMSVHDLIDKFAEIDVFVNIAGDFGYANNPNYQRREEYMRFIMQFISPLEWEMLRGKNIKRKCEAGKYFFTINHDGEITSCIDDKIYGNYFDGIITPAKVEKKCNKICQSLISYPWRKDNDFIPWNSLLEYVWRCKKHRATQTEKIDFFF